MRCLPLEVSEARLGVHLHPNRSRQRNDGGVGNLLAGRLIFIAHLFHVGHCYTDSRCNPDIDDGVGAVGTEGRHDGHRNRFGVECDCPRSLDVLAAYAGAVECNARSLCQPHDVNGALVLMVHATGAYLDKCVDCVTLDTCTPAVGVAFA